MMKLAKEEIRFIDTYLKKNKVIYVDIRQEMIDHIATAVEEKMVLEELSFYDAFKDFMLRNKKDIMKNNKQIWSFSWEIIKQFLMFLAKPYMLFLGLLLLLFFSFVNVNLYFKNHFAINHLFLFLILALCLFQLIYFNVYLKKRFYTVEKTVVILFIIYNFQIFFLPFFGTDTVSVSTLTIFSFLYLSFITFFIIEMGKFHKHRFNYI